MPVMERDLGVPALHRERRAVGQLVPARALRDLLLGKLQADAPATHLALLAEDADLPQEAEDLSAEPASSARWTPS